MSGFYINNTFKNILKLIIFDDDSKKT